MVEPVLLDTSVAVALMLESHSAHSTTFRAIADVPLGLSGHAEFETLSVLTRLPGSQRRTVKAINDAIRQSFPHTRYLSADATRALGAILAAKDIAGGAIYDALVAAVALEHEMTLVTRDMRALPTYQALGVSLRILD